MLQGYVGVFLVRQIQKKTLSRKRSHIPLSENRNVTVPNFGRPWKLRTNTILSLCEIFTKKLVPTFCGKKYQIKKNIDWTLPNDRKTSGYGW